ncbi:MAG TPA: cytochrome c-type biogenesis protein CcmH [Acidimicrobiales bacterium]|nr:cytochrome c-type biogenesis protein CcmH [Acidimicrobiales bacterium]
MRRLVWAGILILTVVALAVGARSREPGARSIAERTQHIAKEVRCPTCEGLSVAESSAPVSESIRSSIADRLREGATDDEVRSYLVSRYGRDILLRPPVTGVGAVVWATPVLAVAVATGAAAVVFRRRRRGGDVADDEAETALDQPVDLELGPEVGSKVGLDGGREREPPVAHRRRRVAVATIAGVGVIGAVVAGALASSSSAREANAPATGTIARGISSRLAMARQLIGEGKVLDAIKAYDAVLADHPDEPEALAYRGWMIRLAGRDTGDPGLIDTGLASIERAVVVDPSYAEARFFRGMVLWQDKSDPDAAVADFEAFLAANPPADLISVVQNALTRARADAAAKAGGTTTTAAGAA